MPHMANVGQPRRWKTIGTIAVTGLLTMGFLSLVPILLNSTAPVAAPGVTFLPDAVPFVHVISTSSGHHKPGGGGGGGGGSTCTTTLPAANGVSFTPAEIRQAYGYSSTYTGAGETIAIIDAYGSPTITSDLACFDQTFSLPAPSLNVVAPFGKVHSNSGWGLETSLDVEWAHAMAPAANLLLIETPSSSFTYLVNDAVPYAVAHGAKVFSMSWGAAESSLTCSTEATEATYFANAVAAGAIPVGASGDSGANDGTSSPTVDYPAADVNVVGAGGTSLTTANTGAYNNETVWNDGSKSATGGGVSACLAEPSYQSSHNILVTTSSGSSTPTGRAVPDVSYDANPSTGVWVYDTSGYSGWVQVGGTSAAAPQWAAIFADALSAGAAINGGNIHADLYNLLGTASLHDVTQGNNGYYSASAGYDACTGVGSPVESSLISAL